MYVLAARAQRRVVKRIFFERAQERKTRYARIRCARAAFSGRFGVKGRIKRRAREEMQFLRDERRAWSNFDAAACSLRGRSVGEICICTIFVKSV